MQKSHKNKYIFIPEQSFILGLVAAVALTALVGYSWFWNIENIRQENINLALAQAKANWNKDAALRQWATRHGGLYVKPDARTPPNPALAHLPNRDVVTTDGQKLTLMNPAYMMRQMTQEFEELFGIKGKITGKVQLNSINKPDEWQSKALNIFEAGGVNEIYEEQMINGQPYIRYMKPMYMEEGCLKCHGILGFKVGDLRGGVSVSIPLNPYFEAAQETYKSINITHLLVWLVGIVVIIAFTKLIRRLFQRLVHEAMHDELTQLPNMTLFKNRLEQALEIHQRNSNYHFSVGFLDLDRFKNLNDSRGHQVGDELLIALADRFSQQLRPGDTVARMGGDEFTLLFNNINKLQDAIEIAERILASLKEPFYIGNDVIFTDASIGLCMVTNRYHNADDMIRDADIAMYRAKSSGKGRIDVFNPDMHEEALEIMQIENDLRVAIEKNQLEVYYQPIIDVGHNCIEGFEALLRWHHPTLGNIPPDRFIPVAESSRQIQELGEWVLEQSCRQISAWNLLYGQEHEFSVSVNISGIQLTEQKLHEPIEALLNKYSFNPSKLHLEVTETVLVGEKEKVKIELNRI
ncbi:MAG: diguanylate cyclase, partial [Gammaproteobacteria bacterium]|nr:diguanylate cyclase [Gammaproteobacteria bacterium]